jgi:LytS/YehU family sensor histidine kinase
VFLLLLTFTVATVTAGFMYARGALLSAKAEAETVRRLAIETQLKLIESQLEPHMLFNTLANLRVLISLDPPRAQAMLDRLISFLRATLGASRAGMHPLQAEFDRLADYLALMGIRMGERLQSSLELPDDLRLQPVPPLLLQPLVENGIKHGLEPKIDGGRIDVRAWAEGERLLISVRDTGIGLAPTDTTAATSGTAFGLSQVRERLAVLYGSAARLTLRAADDPDGGTLACIELPLTPNHADQP